MNKTVTSYYDQDILVISPARKLKQTQQLYGSQYCTKIWYHKKLETENYTKAEKDLLTKSSPESAPIEVMDSLLMERGMRPERGAVAASSTSLFFNFANISVV